MEETQNPGEVSFQLGHSDTEIVFAHYREFVSAEDTKAFWELVPPQVLGGEPVIEFEEGKAGVIRPEIERPL